MKKITEDKKPILADLKDKSLEEMKKLFPDAKVLDTYEEQLEELFLIRNPRFKINPDYKDEYNDFKKEHLGGLSIEKKGNWFYFPWNKFLVHYLSDDMHQEIRTARNKNIITKEEQEKFYNFNIGVAGLSVGSHAALTISMMGGGRVTKLADPDEISGSNLNRIRYDFTKIGVNKCGIVTEQIYQMNPYGDIESYEEGITMENIDQFLAGPPKLDILVEELDNLEMKIRLRLKAKELGIPVVMATDNGDNVIVDIERYDLDKDLEIFNGVAGHLTVEEFQKIKPEEMPRLATKIAGPDVVVPRMFDSLLEVGKTLYSWPQLGDAATLSGVAVAYVVKRISLGEEVRTGKMEINLDSVFDPNYASPEAVDERNKKRSEFKKIVGLEG